MFKKFVLSLVLLSFISASAGELEDALSKNKNVFLYMYTPECGYCTSFTPRYNKLAKMYDKQYTFIKLDASSMYGYKVFRSYGGRYVPYVVLINSKNDTKSVSANCLASTECTERTLIKFTKN